MSTDHTCPRVSNLLLLDSEGKRIAVKYFDENKCAASTGLTPSPSLTCAPRLLTTLHFTAAITLRSLGRSSVTAQGNYEKSVFAKTSRTNARGEGAYAAMLPS